MTNRRFAQKGMLAWAFVLLCPIYARADLIVVGTPVVKSPANATFTWPLNENLLYVLEIVLLNTAQVEKCCPNETVKLTKYDLRVDAVPVPDDLRFTVENAIKIKGSALDIEIGPSQTATVALTGTIFKDVLSTYLRGDYRLDFSLARIHYDRKSTPPDENCKVSVPEPTFVALFAVALVGSAVRSKRIRIWSPRRH